MDCTMSCRELTEHLQTLQRISQRVNGSLYGLYSMSRRVSGAFTYYTATLRALTELLRTLQYAIQRVNGAFGDSTICHSEG
jgi:hypothetical protein